MRAQTVVSQGRQVVVLAPGADCRPAVRENGEVALAIRRQLIPLAHRRPVQHLLDPGKRPRVGDHRLDVARLEQVDARSEEHTSELQSLMRISYAVFCLKKTKYTHSILHKTIILIALTIDHK